MAKRVLTLSSSQIEDFLECATKWFFHCQRNLEPTERRDNVPMNSGTYGHKLLEILYKERAAGNYNGALQKAFDFDVDANTCRCTHSKEKHTTVQDGSIADGLHANCSSIGCNCQLFIPVEFPLSAPDRVFVRQRVEEYTFVEGTTIPELRAESPDHVEVGFSENIYEDDERLYILEGRIDLIGQIATNCSKGWADHKFQARERDLYLKSIQFRNYSMVTKLGLGVVNYIRFAKKIEKDKTFKRSVISFSRLEMESWRENLIQIFNRVEKALYPEGLEGIRVPPEEGIKNLHWYSPSDRLRNRGACSGKFGYPCEYTQLCEESHTPQLIQLLEGSNYKVKPPWRSW